MSNKEWVGHAYPLQQITIQLQGARHSDKTEVIEQLESVLARLKAGDIAGCAHDDDFGYRFEYQARVDSSIFDEPSGSVINTTS